MKKTNRSFFIVLLILGVSIAFLAMNQKKRTAQTEFIETLSYAIPEDAAVFPSVIMAQAILESQWGRSDLSVDAQNYFGIKSFDESLPHTIVSTQEYIDGEMVTIDDAFRVYESLDDSIAGYLELMTLPRYDRVRDAQTFEEAAVALYECGYATDPEYSSKLIDLINTYRLFVYDVR